MGSDGTSGTITCFSGSFCVFLAFLPKMSSSHKRVLVSVVFVKSDFSNGVIVRGVIFSSGALSCVGVRIVSTEETVAIWVCVVFL